MKGNIKSFEKSYTHAEVLEAARRLLRRYRGNKAAAGRYARSMEDRYESRKWRDIVEVLATMPAETPARQLDTEIATSLADRARAKGFEPETLEGGRAMMQSLTLADIAKLENRPAYLAPGTPVEVHFHQVGGTTKLAGTVKWDYRKDVDVKLASYGGRVVRASRSSSGLLNIYHL